MRQHCATVRRQLHPCSARASCRACNLAELRGKIRATPSACPLMRLSLSRSSPRVRAPLTPLSAFHVPSAENIRSLLICCAAGV
jgi:hypothetical protein